VLKPWRKRVVAQAQIAPETVQAPRIVTA